MVTKSFMVTAAGFLGGLALTAGAWGEHLRICPDRNNLLFSNEAREGSGNKISGLWGRKLGRDTLKNEAPRIKEVLTSFGFMLVEGKSGEKL